MQCKICSRLEEAGAGAAAAAAAARSDPPNILLGLNEAGLRNHAREKQELILKAEINLLKHQRSCLEKADNAAV
jgi:hypothetical protein